MIAKIIFFFPIKPSNVIHFTWSMETIIRNSGKQFNIHTIFEQWSNGAYLGNTLMVRALDYQTWEFGFRTTKLVQVRLGISSFKIWSNEYLELLGKLSPCTGSADISKKWGHDFFLFCLPFHSCNIYEEHNLPQSEPS